MFIGNLSALGGGMLIACCGHPEMFKCVIRVKAASVIAAAQELALKLGCYKYTICMILQ
jgi:hypothetical protein